MAKRKVTNTVISKKELFLPRMEFLPLDDSGKGLFVRELGGKSYLEYKEIVQKLEKDINGELSDIQSVELMVDLVYRTICNPDGSPYFESREEASLFADKSLEQLQLAADKALEIAGMGAKKNLKNGLNSSSTDD